MGIITEQMGKGPKGEDLFLYTIENENKTKLSVLNFGCVIYKFLFAGKDGKVRDVILGFENIEDYFEDGKCFGAIVGPIANRTADAKFEIDGTVYKLEVNDNNRNNLHTAALGSLQKRVWDAKLEGNSVIFTCKKDDMDLGIPGNLDAKVTYTLTEDDEIKIDYDVVSDKKTLINMTNHTYFNLNGHDSGSILDESIVLNADKYTPVAPGSIPTGELADVEGTVMDFRTEKKIGKDLDLNVEQLALTNGFDHNFVINGYDKTLKTAATVIDDKSGIVMEALTDLPGIQFYIGNYIADDKGKGGVTYGQRHGLCLESQFFPNSANDPHFERPVFNAGEHFKSTTIYRFSTIAD